MPEATCSQHPKPRHAVRTCSVVGEARWCKKEWLLETMASHYKEWDLDGHASGYHALPSVHYPETSYSTGNPTCSYGIPGSYALTFASGKVMISAVPSICTHGPRKVSTKMHKVARGSRRRL